MRPITPLRIPPPPAIALAAALALTLAARAQPTNDACTAPALVQAGVPFNGDATGATSDGDSLCNFDAAPDVYFSFTTSVGGTYTFSLCSGVAWDTVLSLHTGCPATLDNEIACDDDGCRPPGSSAFGIASSLTVTLPAGQPYLIRLSSYDATVAPGLYTLLVVGPTPATGACCFAGTCTLQTAAVCQSAGGVYRGDYTACAVPAGMLSTYTSADPPRTIPDNAPAGITSTITVPDAFTVGDVRVELTLTHTFAGDLAATISHAGRTATLMQRLGGGANGDDSDFSGAYVLTDAGSDTLWQAAVDGAPDTASVISTLPHRAADRYANTVSLRAAFANTAAAGDWTLTISDDAEYVVGTLHLWRLVLDRAGGDPCDLTVGACCAGATCSLTPAAACAGPNRRFVAAGAACNTAGNRTVPCCNADFNQSGGITVQDIFDFLGAYFTFQPIADISGNGVGVQDIFDFLSAYFTGC